MISDFLRQLFGNPLAGIEAYFAAHPMGLVQATLLVLSFYLIAIAWTLTLFIRTHSMPNRKPDWRLIVWPLILFFVILLW